MFSNSSDISTDAAEGLGSEQGSEAPGDFLFYFGHTKVAFRKVVVKRHIKIMHGYRDGGKIVKYLISVSQQPLLLLPPLRTLRHRPHLETLQPLWLGHYGLGMHNRQKP